LDERQVLAAAIAAEERGLAPEARQRRLVGGSGIALTEERRPGPELRERAEVRLEAEPLQGLEQRRLVAGTTAPTVMVFEAKQHSAPEGASQAPDPYGVGNVAQMEVAGWAGGVARERPRGEPGSQRGKIERDHG